MEVMECKIFDSYLVASRLKAVLDLIERSPMSQKYPIRTDCLWNFFQDGLNLGKLPLESVS